MRRTVRILIYGHDTECSAAVQGMQETEALQRHAIEFRALHDSEAFIEQLIHWNPSLVVVLAGGAEGMECATQSRLRRPELPVFWFSDDRIFGMHAYRMNCAYFSLKPADTEKLNNAFRRCEHLGIPYFTP